MVKKSTVTKTNTVLADKLMSFDALMAALVNLNKVCEMIEDWYLDSLIEDKFEH